MGTASRSAGWAPLVPRRRDVPLATGGRSRSPTRARFFFVELRVKGTRIGRRLFSDLVKSGCSRPRFVAGDGRTSRGRPRGGYGAP